MGVGVGMGVRVRVRVGVGVGVVLRLHVTCAHPRVALVCEERHKSDVRARAARTARGHVAMVARDDEYLARGCG